MNLLEIDELTRGAFSVRVRVAAKIIAQGMNLAGVEFQTATPAQQVALQVLVGGDLPELVFKVASCPSVREYSFIAGGDSSIPDVELIELVEAAMA